jgi:hypothetical protein
VSGRPACRRRRPRLGSAAARQEAARGAAAKAPVQGVWEAEGGPARCRAAAGWAAGLLRGCCRAAGQHRPGPASAGWARPPGPASLVPPRHGPVRRRTSAAAPLPPHLPPRRSTRRTPLALPAAESESSPPPGGPWAAVGRARGERNRGGGAGGENGPREKIASVPGETGGRAGRDGGTRRARRGDAVAAPRRRGGEGHVRGARRAAGARGDEGAVRDGGWRGPPMLPPISGEGGARCGRPACAPWPGREAPGASGAAPALASPHSIHGRGGRGGVATCIRPCPCGVRA